jgi:hypothetical protein
MIIDLLNSVDWATLRDISYTPSDSLASGIRHIFQDGAGQGEYLYEVISVSEENGAFAISADDKTDHTSIVLPECLGFEVEKGDVVGVIFEQWDWSKPSFQMEYEPRRVRIVEKFYE